MYHVSAQGVDERMINVHYDDDDDDMWGLMSSVVAARLTYQVRDNLQLMMTYL